MAILSFWSHGKEFLRTPWGSDSDPCKELGIGVNGDVGTMVENVQRLILRYYTDVGEQAGESFAAAKQAARKGFLLLAATITYLIMVDIMRRFRLGGIDTAYQGMGVGVIGVVAGGIVEVIAGVQFWLYGQAARQFEAFHICLERTHRYLLAYKIADKISSRAMKSDV